MKKSACPTFAQILFGNSFVKKQYELPNCICVGQTLLFVKFLYSTFRKMKYVIKTSKLSVPYLDNLQHLILIALYTNYTLYFRQGVDSVIFEEIRRPRLKVSLSYESTLHINNWQS
jgi:hypothetical protein